ncbi:MAG: DUF87 domain-containing protein [Halobacteriovoraceae bacterium]|nr:DUF87 domain-containing protein [Halobacteriovoraceae bacterium]
MNKILKTELFALFVVTIISFFAYYYREILPDHLLTISYRSHSLSYLSYYGSSLISILGYYTGPWIFFPFIIFSLSYTFIFSRRDIFLDVFGIIILLCSFLSSFYLMAPEFLGPGILQLISIYFSNPLMWLIFGISTIGYIVLTFRQKFFNNITYIYNKLLALGKKREITNSTSKVVLSSNRFQSSFFKTKEKTQNAFAIFKEKWLFKKRNTKEQIQNFDEDNFEDTLEERDQNEENISEVDDINVKEDILEEKIISPTRMDRNFLKTDIAPEQMHLNFNELVECISSDHSQKKRSRPSNEYFGEIIERIENKLEEFKIDGRIINILKGPVVDTFELDLGVGVKITKVTSLQEDLSLALFGAPIRMIYPLKGKQTVGIEVPRNPREIIYLDEILRANEFINSNYRLPVAMGKDAFGSPFVVDLAGMPHMLVAGATGAGKSVFVNTLLVSLLVKKSPEKMKLILIDPKQLELALYSKLPHLCMPVITDAKNASLSLMWAVQEMERRYSILKEFGVRNIEGFNAKLKQAGPELLSSIHHLYDEKSDESYELPYIVIIVDEFADLILTKAGKEIENNICRLAAKARAAGIHLVLATQRPSVDVITGLIKSNFPTRVSFRVTTSVDSRTILNAMGAERLLGKGDMIYKHGVENLRVHSGYVDENEIEALMDKICVNTATFNQNALDFLENEGEQTQNDPYAFGSHITPTNDENEDDDKYFEAVKIVTEHRSASASMLQRRLKVGYNRAANLIELMEERGVVGPAQGSKPRDVLHSPME